MRKVQLTIKQEEVAPATTSDLVVMNNGKTLKEELSTHPLDKFSREVTVYNSMSKIIDGTLDGVYESCVFKGQTLVNVLQNQASFEIYREAVPSYYNCLFDTNGLEANTKYYYKIFNKPTNAKWIITPSDSNVIDYFSYRTESDIEGTVTVNNNVRSKSKLWLKFENGETHSLDELNKVKVLFIKYQDGMENWDIPYFDGICDVKMPILRNVSSLHPFPNGLLCWYDARSGEGEQTLLEDLSGNENHATLRNFQFGGTDGWQDGGIRMVGYGPATGKNSIRTNKQINNAKSMCIYFKRLGSTTPWYLFDGRESSTIYWYSGGYTGINRSNSSKNGVQLSGNNDAVLPEIGNTAMVYIEFTDNIPITPTLMGRHSGNESLDGVFYAFMLYDRALTTEEVAMNMEYAKSFDYIKDISPLDFRNIDKTNILRTSEEIVLREVNGVQDTYNLLTGEYVQRIGEIVLDGSEGWSLWKTETPYLLFEWHSSLPIKNGNTTSVILADKLPVFTGDVLWNSSESRGIGSNENRFRIRIECETAEALKSWLQSNPITVQYELAEPVTTIVEPSTIPFAYENGHIILESGSEEQSLLPELKYSAPASKNGVISTTSKTILKHEQRLHKFENLLLRESILMDYRLMLTMLDSM